MTASPAEKTAAPKTGADDDGHVWIGAATVALTLPQAKRADLRGSIRVAEQTRIDVLETYCKACRRPFEDAAGRKCAALSEPEMFHGGPIGIRAKRTGHGIPGHDCIALGCNTAIAVATAQAQQARRNGVATDIREKRPAPPPAPAKPQRRGSTGQGTARKRLAAAVAVAPVVALDPDAEARYAARVLASRRGKRREANPMALTLW